MPAFTVQDHQAFLSQRIKHIEDVLPDFCKNQGERLIKRAMLTISKSETLMACTPKSIFLAVVSAAELGLAIDGKLAHAVPYNSKTKVDGKEAWEKQAQFQIDYKGMVSVARRSGTIKDTYANVVYTADQFVQRFQNGKCELNHTPSSSPDRTDTPILGAYAVIIFPDGYWRHEWMDKKQLDAIKNRSKAKQKGFSPWDSDEQEMQRKTVLKRALKLFLDMDSMLVTAYLAEDEEDVIDVEATPADLPQGRVSKRPALGNDSPIPADFNPQSGKAKQPAKATQKQAPATQQKAAVSEDQEEPVEEHEPDEQDDSSPADDGQDDHYPPWMQTKLNEIAAANKASLVESIGNQLLTDFRNPETPEPDKEQCYPTLFRVFGARLGGMVSEADSPRVEAKLATWRQYLGVIHADMMKAYSGSN